MIIGHSRPKGVTWSVTNTGGSDPQMVTSGANLGDGRPDTLDRFKWMSGTPGSLHKFHLRASWPIAQQVRIVGVQNISLPDDLLITLGFHRVGDPGGTFPYAPAIWQPGGQRIVTGPRGERTAWFVIPPGPTPVNGMELQYWNNVGGAAVVPADTLWTQGEVVIFDGTDIDIAIGAIPDATDPTVQNFSWSNQPYTVPGTPYRQLQMELATASEATWRTVYDPLLAKMDRGQFCAYILRYKDLAGAFDGDLLHYYAMQGLMTRLPSRPHYARDIFKSGQLAIVESPIPT